MPRHSTHYDSGKIYKLIHKNHRIQIVPYIGSTTLALSMRMALHRSGYRNVIKYGGKCASHKIFDEYGVDNIKIVLIEEYPCKTSAELCEQEEWYLENVKCVNEKRAFQSAEDRRADQRARSANFYKHNKVQKNKDCLKRYYQKKLICEFLESIASV